MRGFTLHFPRPVAITVEGKSHTDKGFMLYVMDAKEYETNFEHNKKFQHLPSFEGLTVRSFGHTDTLPAGSWCAVVQNSENILNTMVVHLRIVVDPS